MGFVEYIRKWKEALEAEGIDLNKIRSLSASPSVAPFVGIGLNELNKYLKNKKKNIGNQCQITRGERNAR